MAPPDLATGSLAFVGPTQVPALAEFHYVQVDRIDESSVYVKTVDPTDNEEEAIDDPVDIAVLRRRLVTTDERAHWPGSFVGRPIAFIRPDGDEMDTWAYGVVTGYSMQRDQARLHIQYDGGTSKVVIRDPANVIKANWLNYVLQTGAGVNSATLNAIELTGTMDDMCALCAKSRTAVPVKVSNALSVPFESEALVTIIRPDTLATMSVPRQHVLECALNRKGKKRSLFDAPAPTRRTGKRKTATKPSLHDKPSRVSRIPPRQKRKIESASDGSEFEKLSSDDEGERADTLAVQRQNQPLVSGPVAPMTQPSRSHPELDELRGRSATTYRPTIIEQQIHDSIGHPDHQGKDSQHIFEFEQQARGSYLRATSPILRGAYDFGFHVRGLSAMHFARVTQSTLMDCSAPVVNMTDFSRKNCLQPADANPTFSELVNALENLRRFGRSFYNESTVDVLSSIVGFIESFAEGSEPERETTQLLLLWVNLKLCKFRGLVLSDGLDVAIRIQDEFSLQDALLSRLLYDQQKAKLADLTSLLAKKSTGSGMNQDSERLPKTPKQTGTPAAVLHKLPTEGKLSLCMMYLSKAGCRGNGVPGKCFSNKRAHFRPKNLPREVKDHIMTRLGGLAPEFEDL